MDAVLWKVIFEFDSVRKMCLKNTIGHLQVFKLFVVDSASLNWIFAEAYLVKQNLRLKNPGGYLKDVTMSHFLEHCLAWLQGGRDRRVIKLN